MFKWINNFFDQIAGISFVSKMYLLGGTFVVFSASLKPYSIGWIPEFSLAFGWVAFGLGFLMWIHPKILNLWKSRLFRRLLLFLHLAVLIASASAATSLMSEATGLHGRDFPISVSAISLLIYPVMWIWIATLCAGLLAIFMQILMFARLIIAHVVSFLPAGWRGARGRPAISHVLRPLGHMLGAFSFVLGVGFLVPALESSIPWVQRIGMLVAYLGDYQPVESFPGIRPGARVVMHGDGVYSEIFHHGWGRVSVTAHRLSED